LEVFLSIVFTPVTSESGHPTLIAFQLQEQVGDPPDFPKARILRFPHDECVGVGGSDFRSAFVRRRTIDRLLQENFALRLTSLHLPCEDIFQKLARPFPRLPFRWGDVGISLILHRFESVGILLAFLWLAGIRR